MKSLHIFILLLLKKNINNNNARDDDLSVTNRCLHLITRKCEPRLFICEGMPCLQEDSGMSYLQEDAGMSYLQEDAVMSYLQEDAGITLGSAITFHKFNQRMSQACVSITHS